MSGHYTKKIFSTLSYFEDLNLEEYSIFSKQFPTRKQFLSFSHDYKLFLRNSENRNLILNKSSYINTKEKYIHKSIDNPIDRVKNILNKTKEKEQKKYQIKKVYKQKRP